MAKKTSGTTSNTAWQVCRYQSSSPTAATSIQLRPMTYNMMTAGPTGSRQPFRLKKVSPQARNWNKAPRPRRMLKPPVLRNAPISSRNAGTSNTAPRAVRIGREAGLWPELVGIRSRMTPHVGSAATARGSVRRRRARLVFLQYGLRLEQTPKFLRESLSPTPGAYAARLAKLTHSLLSFALTRRDNAPASARSAPR
jgi:hypothetical protein